MAFLVCDWKLVRMAKSHTYTRSRHFFNLHTFFLHTRWFCLFTLFFIFFLFVYVLFFKPFALGLLSLYSHTFRGFFKLTANSWKCETQRPETEWWGQSGPDKLWFLLMCFSPLYYILIFRILDFWFIWLLFFLLFFPLPFF